MIELKTKAPSPHEDDPLFVSSVEKAFKVLEAFGPERQDLSLVEISKRTGLNKSSAQRFSHTLHRLGYLDKDASSRRYMLSKSILKNAHNFLRVDPLVTRATPYIVELRRQLKERVGLNTRYEFSAMYLIPLQSNQEAFPYAHPGFRIPLYCSSAGRIFLANLGDTEARDILAASDKIKHTDKTIVDTDAIMKEVRLAYEQGYCITDQEYRMGDINMSAPIFDGQGNVTAAITVACSRAKWSREDIVANVAPVLIQTTRAISLN